LFRKSEPPWPNKKSNWLDIDAVVVWEGAYRLVADP